MPFGLHKNKEISDLPTEYLAWCSGNIRDSPVRQEIIDELFRRNHPEKGVTKKYDPVTGANKLIEVILMLPHKFFECPFTLNTIEGQIQVRIERIKSANNNTNSL